MSVIPGTIVPAPLVIVYEGAQVGVGVGVRVAVGVGVKVAVGVGVNVGVDVAVAVAVAVGVEVGVRVAVGLGVGVNVAVGVGEAPPAQLYLTFRPAVRVDWRHEKVVAGPPALCCTPLSSELPLSTVTP